MATPTRSAYSCASGGSIYAGRFAPSLLRDPDVMTYPWPPTATCSIPAVGGINAPIHPKVLDTGGWNGYRYWMAFTPYPYPNNDTVENPSVVASNDGDTWVAPAANPIEPAPSGAQQNVYYNSDTHLVLRDGVMYLIWRLYDNRASTWIERCLYRTSTDGVSWSATQPMNLESTNGSSVSLLLSPTVEFFDGAWWCWTYRRNVTPIVCELRKAPNISGPWSSPQLCTLALPDTTREPWHLDVVRVRGGWAMLISDRGRSDTDSHHLTFAYAGDDGLVWDVKSTVFGITPDCYRSSLVRKPGGFDCWLTDWDIRAIKRLSITDTQIEA